MKIKLNSKNTEHYPSMEKTLILTVRKDEIIISTDTGEEIASLEIEIMDKDVDNKIVPSNSYFLIFNPVVSQTDKAVADVFLE